MESLNLTTGKVVWSTKVKGLPLGAATVSNNLIVTSLFEGKLLAFNRTTGKLVFTHSLPATTNSTLAIAGDTIIVPMGGPKDGTIKGGTKILAFRVPTSVSG